jgi:hypothetical protein
MGHACKEDLLELFFYPQWNGILHGYITLQAISRDIQANNVSLAAMNAELSAQDLCQSVPSVEVPVIFMLSKWDRQLDSRPAALIWLDL